MPYQLLRAIFRLLVLLDEIGVDPREWLAAREKGILMRSAHLRECALGEDAVAG